LEDLRAESGADFAASTLVQAVDICLRQAISGGQESIAAQEEERPRAIA
jgi:hypothetical protein